MTTPRDDGAHDRLCIQSFEARRLAWSQWGEVHRDVLSPLLNPSFRGGPRWPALRQAYSVVHRRARTLVASDGLSDPFDDRDVPGNGLGIEFFAVGPGRIDHDQLRSSWLFDIVRQVSQFAAEHRGIAPMLDELQLLTMEPFDVRIPHEHLDEFVSDDRRVGVLLGADVEGVPGSADGPLSRIRLCSLQILTLAELDHAVNNGAAAREALARGLRRLDSGGLNDLQRETLV